MGNARDQRKARARLKKKKSRAKAQESRSRRSTAPKVGPKQAALWPTGTCYISENWYEIGQTIRGIFVRQHHTGAHALVSFEVDMAESGFTNILTQVGLTENGVMAEVVKHTEGVALHETDAGAVAQLFREAATFHTRKGASLPASFRDAKVLFGEDYQADGHLDLQFGSEEDHEVTEEVVKPTGITGFIGRLFGR